MNLDFSASFIPVCRKSLENALILRLRYEKKIVYFGYLPILYAVIKMFLGRFL